MPTKIELTLEQSQQGVSNDVLRCKDAHLLLNGEKCHFMVKEGIVLGHKILLQQEFDIEIKDKKGIENVVADHLSRIDNNESSDDNEVDDNFPRETLMEINTKNEPWFADFAYNLVGDIIPKGMMYQQKNKFFSDLKYYTGRNPIFSKYVLTGINFMGPFPKSHKFEYILGAIDYVSKWAEAQAFPTNDALVVVSFLKKLFCRFGMPKALISDRGTHFCNKIMEKTMKKYRVNHRFSTSYHPQISGQVENTNRALKRILKKTIKDNPAIWSRKLDDALWAFRTAYKTPTGTTAYKLIYGKNCHIPFKIEHHAYRHVKNCNPDLIAAGEKRMFQLHELDELRYQAYENYKLDDEEKDDKEGDVDYEDDETESDEDDIYRYKIRVGKDEDEEMLNAGVEDSDKGDEEVTDAAKADAEKTSEVKDDAKKTKLPPTISSLSVSSGFGDQFLKLSSDYTLVSIVKDTTDAEINLLLEIKIQSKVPQIQSPSMLRVPISVISEPSVPTLVQEYFSIATVTTLPPLSVSTTSSLRVAKLEKDVSELKKIDLSTESLASLKTQVPFVKIPELPKKWTPTVDLEQESEKTPSEILKIKKKQAEKQKMLKFTIKSTDKAALKEYDQKSALYHTMHANKNHDDDEDNDNEDPPAGPNQCKNTNRRRTKESESSKKPSTTKEALKGKSLSKGSKTSKFASAKEPVEEPIAEVVMDNVGDDVVHNDDQTQDASEPKTAKTSNPEWFTQPPMPPTSDPKWNKRQVVHDQPEQPWFNKMVFDTKDPLTFDDLMATPIDFSNHLTVAVDYFFNNDLEYLKYSDPERMYTTSITKTKAARYEIKRIEDLVNKFSKHNVYSTKKILGVKSVSVKKLHGYGQLENIVLKRADRQLYKFKEGDFVDLYLNEIKDMLLLIMALHMFTRSLVIKKRVKDLQLGVESYQKKLNITSPQQTFLEIQFKELYTLSHKPPGVIYEDLTKQKRVMRADELYKFSDGTLKKVRDKLHHRIHDFRLEYNKELTRRKWTAIDRKRSELMVRCVKE
ncbi:retrovirus-related pol polyprotein from transposon TNT 1-94 [Tanacetum coccineum]